MLSTLPLVNMLVALLITLALILGLALLLRRLGPNYTPPSRSRRLAKLESLQLTPQHTLHLVVYDSDEHLIVTGPHGTVTVTPTKNKKTGRA